MFYQVFIAEEVDGVAEIAPWLTDIFRGLFEHVLDVYMFQ